MHLHKQLKCILINLNTSKKPIVRVIYIHFINISNKNIVKNDKYTKYVKIFINFFII